MILNNTGVHGVYCLMLDYVGTDLVLETHAGRGRLYACYVMQEVSRHGPYSRRAAAPGGFTIAEWLAPQPRAEWGEALVAVHKRWGGGRELAYTEVRDLLDLIFRVRKLALAIELRLEAQAPDDVRERQRAWDQQPRVSTRAPLSEWAEQFRHMPSLVSYIVSEDGYRLFSNGSYQGTPFSLSVPMELFAPFQAAYAELTGNFPASFVLTSMLYHSRYRRYTEATPTGERRHFGWSLYCISVPH